MEEVRRQLKSDMAALRFCLQALRFLSYQLPSRRFWMWWCGGMSVGEFLAVLFWLAMNAWWLGMMTSSSVQRINAGKSLHSFPTKTALFP